MAVLTDRKLFAKGFLQSVVEWKNLTSEWDKPINDTDTTPPHCHLERGRMPV